MRAPHGARRVARVGRGERLAGLALAIIALLMAVAFLVVHLDDIWLTIISCMQP